jgi:hypothetical protein
LKTPPGLRLFHFVTLRCFVSEIALVHALEIWVKELGARRGTTKR